MNEVSAPSRMDQSKNSPEPVTVLAMAISESRGERMPYTSFFQWNADLSQNGMAFWLMKCIKETKPAFHKLQARSN